MRESFKLQKNLPLTRALEKFEPDYKKEYVEHFKNWEKGKEEYEQTRVEDESVGRAQSDQVGGR